MQGLWQTSSNHQYTNLTGTAMIRDIGNALIRLGMPASIVGKNGKLLFNLEWPNPPYDPLIKSLSGSLTIALDDGRIVDISEEASRKIGIGQLLNFFSLQNLPHHLTLDFSDVSKRGFPFDTMRGNFILKNGNAYTKDTYWDGPVAYISMKGKINLANENYDLYLNVSPHITSSLPIVATIAGGPVVGLTTWVADRLLNKQVGKFITYSYHMRGPWSKPSLTQREPLKSLYVWKKRQYLRSFSLLTYILRLTNHLFSRNSEILNRLLIYILSQPCTHLKNVGEKTTLLLKKCGIQTIQDLLFHLPYSLPR